MFKQIWNIVSPYVIVVIILLVCIMMLYYGLRGPTSSYIQDILDKQIERYRIEYQNNINIKDREIQERDKQIIELSKKYATSQNAYIATKKELDLLKREIIDINEPADIKEVKDRLKALGYNIR